jgi:hypothetical protein
MDQYFKEWEIYSLKKNLISRQIDINSILELSKVKIVSLTGIRRSGKSSILILLSQLLKKEGKDVLYCNLEDMRLKTSKNVLDDLLKFFGDKGTLLLDEITNIPDWDNWLTRIHEMTKGQLSIICTSSIRSLLIPTKSLRGRMVIFDQFTLSFAEFLRFKEFNYEHTTAGLGKLEQLFEEYLIYGGFPEIALIVDNITKINIILGYFRDILGLDVANLSNINLSLIELFGKYTLETTFFSASKCYNFLKTLGYKIAKQTILEIEKSSESASIFFFVPIYATSIKDRSQYPRKVYAGDTGFYYSITGKIDYGKLLVNIVYLELRRSIKPNQEINYWRNQAGYECDLIIREGLNVKELYQVCYNFEDEKTKKREIRGVFESAKEFNIKSGIIITKNAENDLIHDGIQVKIIPILKWLKIN